MNVEVYDDLSKMSNENNNQNKFTIIFYQLSVNVLFLTVNCLSSTEVYLE